MSQYGPPPDQPDPNEPTAPSEPAGQGGSGGYNPYPDDWSAPGTPQAPANPYGEPTPYAGVAQPGAGAALPNPYGGTASQTKETFGFGGYAPWLARVGAYLIDYICGTVVSLPLGIGYVLILSNTTTTTNPDGTTTSHYEGSLGLPLALILVGAILSLAFFVWNVCIRQGRTGATIGKSVLAIRLVNADLQPIGAGWSFLRSILHIVDVLPCVCLPLGYLWPLWDAKKQTFADKIMSTLVISATTPQPRVY